MITTVEQFETFGSNALDTLRDIVRQTRCRIVHGHLMENLGRDTDGTILYACARCHRVEALTSLA